MAEKTNETTTMNTDNVVMFKERKRWLFFGLPFTFTKYTITADGLIIDAGFFKTTEDDCYMYKIQDVRHTATLIEKIFRLGTVTCYTGDVTHPELKLIHIKHSKEVKNYLMKASEEARIKRRTMNMVNIGAQNMDEIEDIIDNMD